MLIAACQMNGLLWYLLQNNSKPAEGQVAEDKLKRGGLGPPHCPALDEDVSIRETRPHPYLKMVSVALFMSA